MPVQRGISLGEMLLPFIVKKAKEFTSKGGVSMHADDVRPMDVFPVDRDSGELTKDSHVTELDAMMKWGDMDVVKTGTMWSTLALDIKAVQGSPEESDSPEHSLTCARVYSSLTSGRTIQKVCGGQETTLEDITAQSKKKMVGLIDSLASQQRKKRLVFEASGKVDKLKCAVKEYSQNPEAALAYIDEYAFFQNGPAECSLFESKVPMACLFHFDELCIKAANGENMEAAVREACSRNFRDCDTTCLPSFPALKEQFLKWFPQWQTVSPFPVNEELKAAMQEGFRNNFDPLVELIVADWMSCRTMEELCNPFRNGATVTLTAQCIGQNSANPIDHLEYMFLCQWKKEGYGIAVLPKALPKLIADHLQAWVHVKLMECELSLALIEKKKITYASANLRIGDMNNEEIQAKVIHTGQTIAENGWKGWHAVEVTEYTDDIESKKVIDEIASPIT